MTVIYIFNIEGSGTSQRSWSLNFSPDCSGNPFWRRLRRRQKDCSGKRDDSPKEFPASKLLNILRLIS